MLELYHSVNSVCAQKVRIALAEKGLEWTEHVVDLFGGQFDPAYLKLNPNAVVPTLVHDGKVVIESSVILYYVDEAFPKPALMPADPLLRARVRMYNKLIDEYVHNACTILTFATAFRPGLAKLSPEALEAKLLAPSPSKKRAEYKRDVIAHGLASKFVGEALELHQKLLGWMEESLERGAWLAGDSFSLADAAVIPYILRLDFLRMAQIWAERPRIAQWYDRMRQRPSVRRTILDAMGDKDWAPFKSITPDPWPTVREILAA
ncbi:MAG TPA: glutathione S-transferase family protein [Alphaproteobacteria bacterium]|nr:glutathione S-transferase family protein [Alphaproteobacteria bacterium]